MAAVEPEIGQDLLDEAPSLARRKGFDEQQRIVAMLEGPFPGVQIARARVVGGNQPQQVARNLVMG